MLPEENVLQRVQNSFANQGMMQHLGATLTRVQAGLCEITLPYSDKVTQQQKGFHGGAIAAIADIAAGYAGLTMAPAGTEVTSVEFKINFLAAFQSGELRASGHVVKAGRCLIVTAAEVAHVDSSGKESACAVLQQTLMVVPKKY